MPSTRKPATQRKRQWHTEEEKDALVAAYHEWRESPWTPDKLTSRALAEKLGVSYGWLMALVRERKQQQDQQSPGTDLEALVTRLVMDNTKLTMELDDLKRRLAALESKPAR